MRCAVGVLLLFAAGAANAQPADVDSRYDKEIDSLIAARYRHIDSLYKDIHAHPELAFQEVETARKLAKELRDLGFEVTEGVGKTGVVGVLRNGPGPTVLVRTELDALPMEEKTGLPYASKATTVYEGKQTPVAHSCGHDVHMAAWAGAAETLVALKDRWKGTLMFVAQPAEEVLGGANAMLQDGLFTRFAKPDVAFALHAWAIAYGEIGLNRGPFTSSADSVAITFKGRGAHGSAPDKSIDPVVVAARFIVDVQTVISREKDPFRFGVFSVGSIHGGTTGNIIPDSVELRGTVRSYDPAVRQKIAEGIARTAKAAAAMGGAPEPQVQIIPGVDAVINDAALVERTEAVFKAAFDPAKVEHVPPIAPSDDFSQFGSTGVPEMFFLVGLYDPKDVEASKAPGGKPLPVNHSPFFAPVPEPTIKTSVKAMSLAVLAALDR